MRAGRRHTWTRRRPDPGGRIRHGRGVVMAHGFDQWLRLRLGGALGGRRRTAGGDHAVRSSGRFRHRLLLDDHGLRHWLDLDDRVGCRLSLHNGLGCRLGLHNGHGLLLRRRLLSGCRLLPGCRLRGLLLRCRLLPGCRLLGFGLLRLQVADEALAYGLAARTISLCLDDSGGMALGPYAQGAAEVQDLRVGHPQFSRQLVDADASSHCAFGVLFSRWVGSMGPSGSGR